MGKLSEMPNIGKVLERKLNGVGIEEPDELIKVGSKDAFLRIMIRDNEGCLDMLCALEGAIEGIRWHFLSEEMKAELRSFHQSMKGDKGI